MFCCKEFEKEAIKYKAPVGGGFLYPHPNPDGQFEQDDDGTWNIYGCCGGGCYVVTGVKYCPFCGSRVDNKSIQSDG